MKSFLFASYVNLIHHRSNIFNTIFVSDDENLSLRSSFQI